MVQEEYRKQGYLLEDFRLFHLQGQGGVKTEYHYHEFCKLLLLLSGSGSYWIEGQRYRLQPGDAVLLKNGCVHKPEFEPGSPYERVIIYISPEFLRRMSLEDCDLGACFQNRILRSDRARSLQRLALDMEKALSGNEYGCQVIGVALLLRLLVELRREQQRLGEPLLRPNPAQDGRIRQLMAYIEAHLTEELSVEMLAERFFWSKYHMMRRFRAETGSSIGQYITQRRLMLARELISQGYSATESCFRAGFGSYSSFTRTYGKFFGTTPTGRLYRAADPMDGEE